MNTDLLKKLAGYASMASAFLYCNEGKAQILYTDVTPDDTLKDTGVNSIGWDLDSLDLNNDGTFDFSVGQVKGMFNRWYGGVIYNLSGPIVNSVMGSLEYSSSYTSSAIRFPYQLLMDDAIGPSGNWVKPNLHNTFSPSPYGAAAFNIRIFGDPYGVWINGADGYVGIRLNDNGIYLYGWIRLKVDPDAYYVILKDYAINVNPDEAITAGKGGTTGIPPIASEKSLSISPNPVGNHATISFYLIAPSVVELTLMDVQGCKIKTLATDNPGNNYSTGAHAINCNFENLPGGCYFIILTTGTERQVIKMIRK